VGLILAFIAPSPFTRLLVSPRWNRELHLRQKTVEVGKDIFNMYLKANGYSTSHFDHMYTWAHDWACSNIIEYKSATECDLSDSTVAYATICDLSDLSDTD
jgi:hypothetical protein